jgi:hypothetical protein
MGSTCLALHWTPSQFWDATPHEVMSIVEAQEEHANA